jgi:hypothetical protein
MLIDDFPNRECGVEEEISTIEMTQGFWSGVKSI